MWWVIFWLVCGRAWAAERAFVDVNRAGVRELAAVPGMGAKLARAVVESREREGPFEHAGQLLRVKGMGPVKGPRLARYLVFPREEEPGDGWLARGQRPSRPIDLNIAQASELAPLPGMGWGLAYRVVAERDRWGAFRTLDDLHYVAGVTRERVRAWSAYLYVEGTP